MNLATLQIVRPIPEGRNVVATVLGRAGRVAGIYLVIAGAGITVAFGVRMLGVRGLMSGTLGFMLATLVSSVAVLYVTRRLPFTSSIFKRRRELLQYSRVTLHYYKASDTLIKLRALEHTGVDPEALQELRRRLVEERLTEHPVVARNAPLAEAPKDDAVRVQQNEVTDEPVRHTSWITKSLEWMSSGLAAMFAFIGAVLLAFRFESALLGGIVLGLWLGAVAVILTLALECIILLETPRDSRGFTSRFHD